MIANDIRGDSYEIEVTQEPPKGAAFKSVVLTFEDVLHPHFFDWFSERIAPRLVHQTSYNLKEFP